MNCEISLTNEPCVRLKASSVMYSLKLALWLNVCIRRVIRVVGSYKVGIVRKYYVESVRDRDMSIEDRE